MFNEYYTSVTQNILLKKLQIKNFDKTNLQCNSMFHVPVTESELMKIIKNMKN